MTNGSTRRSFAWLTWVPLKQKVTRTGPCSSIETDSISPVYGTVFWINTPSFTLLSSSCSTRSASVTWTRPSTVTSRRITFLFFGTAAWTHPASTIYASSSSFTKSDGSISFLLLTSSFTGITSNVSPFLLSAVWAVHFTEPSGQYAVILDWDGTILFFVLSFAYTLKEASLDTAPFSHMQPHVV